jgi:very-short-patch-repair endonuclease
MNNHNENLAYGASREIAKNAKSLRANMTEAETVLWSKLRNSLLGGYKFRRQHPIDQFIADFYCHQKRVVVELDGGVHLHPDRKAYDEGRTAELERWDIGVIRFKNEEVLEEMDKVLKCIKEFCDRREDY